MAKILVADDNSNVQKTLALALANLGVEISAVNNGEAAVRKLPDVSPDLILADIFMPVRNGYEVCEYAKKDPRFSHVPVILLVGAFDPFDEREAQRVGADGVLKKPFVPPEPLITMVKTLLDRSLGERLVAASPPKTISSPKTAIAAKENSGSVAVAEIPAPIPEVPEESSAQVLIRPVEHVTFGEGEHPVAFGDLLETPTMEAAAPITEALEPVDDEQILTSSRPATLGDPIFWRNDSSEPEAPQDAPAAASELGAWKTDETTLLDREDGSFLQPAEPIELVREEQDEASPSVVDPNPILLDAAAQAPLTVDSHKPDDLAANPLEWMATVPAEAPREPALEATRGWNENVPDETETVDIMESSVHPLGMAPVSSETMAPVSSSVPDPVLDEQDAIIPEESPAPPVPEPAIPEFATPTLSAPALTKPEAVSTVSSQRTIDTVRSIPLRDWQDMTAALEVSDKLPLPQENKSVAEPEPQPPVTEMATSQPVLSAPRQLPELASESSQPMLSASEQLSEVASEISQPMLSVPEQLPEVASENSQPVFSASEQLPEVASESPQPMLSASEQLPEVASESPQPILSVPEQLPEVASESSLPVLSASDQISEAAGETSHPVLSVPEQLPEIAMTSSQPNPAAPAKPVPADPILVDAVVERVMDKMRPQLVDIITKELLRPIVQALVQREIDKQ